MDKALRPERFETLPNTATSAKEFSHWLKTFEHYCEVLPQDNLDTLKLITVYISPEVYDFVRDYTTYDTALLLKTLSRDCNFQAVTAEKNK